MESEQQSFYSENQVDSNFINYLNEQSNQNQNISTIPKNITTTENNTVKTFFNSLDKELKKTIAKLPYPKGDEIPDIKIRDEDFFVSGEEIKLYDKNYTDNKFNKCKNCGKNENSYFCSICNSNLCQKCIYNKCKKENHKLIDLKNMKENIENVKKEILNIALKYNIEQKKLEGNPNLKSNKADGFTEDNFNDVNYDNRNFFSTNDIKLIRAILLNDYNNYFHFQNIKRCYDYLKNFYDDIYDNDCLKIEYGIDNNNINNEIEHKIFGKEFVNNNKDKINLIINGKRSELIEKTKISENYLQIILIQKTKEDYIENLSYMFCDCKFNSIEFKKMKNRKELNLGYVTNISAIFL